MAEKGARRESLGEIFTRDFLILSTINLSMFFGFQMLNVGLPVYMAQLGATGQIVGLATTLMTVMATLMRVFAGALIDRFGRMGMLIGGCVVMVCSIVSFAIFPIVGVILGLRLIHGIGWGMGSTASSTIAADIIPKRRFAEGMGYFAMTNAISSALAPAASIELIQGAGSVYMVYVAAGVTVLSLALSVVEMLLTRKKAATAAQAPLGPDSTGEGLAAPAQGAGGEMLGPSEGDKPHSAEGDIPRPADAALPHGAQAGPMKEYSKIETLFERRAIVPGILIMLVNVGFGCITTFIALHAEAQGVSGVSAYFIVYAIVTLASRPFIGRLIDINGYRLPAILSTLCTAGTLALIGVSSNILMFAGAGVLGGLGIGTAMGTYQAMAVANVEPWRRGVATSTYMTAFDLGIAIGSLLGGFLADAHGYTIMYFCVALFPIAACIVSAAIIKSGEGSRDERT